MLRKVILFSVILSVAGLSLGCKGGGQQGQQMPPPLVIIAEATVEDVHPTESFVGRTDAAMRATITARVNGFLERRLVREGDYVEQGQVLFTIEREQYIAAVRQAESALAQARAGFENARLQKERGQALLESASISQARFDDLTAAEAAARANVAAAEAALSAARLNLTYTSVTSPIAGKVGLINFNIGETIGPNVGALTTVIAQEPMYVLFSVSERQIQSLRREFGVSNNTTFTQALIDGADLQLVLSDGSLYAHKGKINFTDNEIDGTTGSLRIRGEFVNPQGQLTQGQTVTVLVQGKNAVRSVTVPQIALINDVSGRYVLVVDENNNVSRVNVELGERLDGSMQVIRSGLNGGERIIIEGMQKVRPNMPVTAMTREQYNQMIQQQQQQGR